VWAGERLFAPGGNNEWSTCYWQVYRANVVLSKIDNIDRQPGDEAAWQNTKGSALFLRGISFAQVAWIWSVVYDKNTATMDKGIPLRLDPDFNVPSFRSSVAQSYEQITSDLKQAADLLPVTPVHVLRPSRTAAYGWLARVYLSMGQYDSAFVYADKYLHLRSSLMDFNLLNASSASPISNYNEEVAYHGIIFRTVTIATSLIDSVLYKSYDDNDLRKTVYFRSNGNGTYRFKGSYNGSNSPGEWFNGIANDEMYLIRAECNARKGNKDAALSDLNTLMIKRWKNNGTWTPFTATDPAEALTKVLNERRKELTQRGLRWMDIKRLNKEGASIVLNRILNGQTYMLQPNDPKYALPIPEEVIAITGMPQN
jgi:tetratricopeptide (TPR) repeat protein